MGGAQQIRAVERLVRARLALRPTVVVSAVSGTTDALLNAFATTEEVVKEMALRAISEKHRTIINDLWSTQNDAAPHLEYLDRQMTLLQQCLQSSSRSKEARDAVLSVGEALSSYIVASYMTTRAILAQQVLASDIIVTNSHFGAATVIDAPTRKAVNKVLIPLLEKQIVPVVTGFIAANRTGRTTTFGRGGSDYTAALLGNIMGANEIQIWTDVDGMFTTDPRVCKEAQLLEAISFREASELATYGAKILHPKTIQPAIAAGIPVRILNTFAPDSSGTLITSTTRMSRAVTAIAFKKQVVLVNVYAVEMFLQEGFLARVFAVLYRHHISVNIVSASETSVSFTLDNDEDLAAAMEELNLLASVEVVPNVGTVSLVGDLLASKTILRRVFHALEAEGIVVRMISMATADTNLSLLIPTDQVIAAVIRLHHQLLGNHTEKNL